MTLPMLLLLIAAIIVVGLWVVRRVYDNSGDRLIVLAPELENVGPNERGAVWLQAISRTLLQSQVIAGFMVVLAVVAGLFLLVGDSIPDRWHSAGVFAVLLLVALLTRPLIVRRARPVLLTDLNNRSNDGE